MSDLSYLILHYNRPFLLETNIELVRKYAPKNTQVIVADDGSDEEVVQFIKKLDIDDIFVQKKNKNKQKEGTCSNTIKKARDLCKKEFFFFSEDDFYLSGSPITSWEYLKNKEVTHRIFFKDCKYNIFDKSIKLLKENKNILNVQLGRDPQRVPVSKNFVQDGLSWHFVDHKQKGGCYYCNWPNLSRLEDHKKFDIPKDLSIWSLEGKMASGFDAAFGKHDWAVVPEQRYYWHVGTVFSKRLNSFSKSQKRNLSIEILEKKVFGEKISKNLENFSALILDAWKKGYFKVNPKELIEQGLNSAFTTAFEGLNSYINKL